MVADPGGLVGHSRASDDRHARLADCWDRPARRKRRRDDDQCRYGAGKLISRRTRAAPNIWWRRFSSAPIRRVDHLATNKPVMALGGFSGSDPILTTSQWAALVANSWRVLFFASRWPFWWWRWWPRRRAEQPDKLGSVELHGSFGERGAVFRAILLLRLRPVPERGRLTR